MKKPEYELGPLRAGILQCNINITAFQRAIAKERERKKEYEGYVTQWEKYNKWQSSLIESTK